LQNSTTTTGVEMMENWNSLNQHQSHPAVLSAWTPGVNEFAPYMQWVTIVKSYCM